MMYNINDEYVMRLLTDCGTLKSREDYVGVVWFELPQDGSYLILFEDGEHYHTYYNPENWG